MPLALGKQERGCLHLPVGKYWRRAGRALAAIVAAAVLGNIALPKPPGAPQTLQEAAQKHHLLMGTGVGVQFLSEPAYAATLAAQYSQLEPENCMKFDQIHPQPDTYSFDNADRVVEFAAAHSMLVRGHTLVWHQQVPGWVMFPRVPRTPAALSRILEDHITTVVGHFKGKVYAWDVVNEPFNDDGTMRSTIWYDKPGIGFAGQGTKTIEQALRWAHAADPSARLFVNEYGAELPGRKSDALYAMARDFIRRGVPLSGIGFQLHTAPSFDHPDSLDSFRRNLRRFAALGIEIQFTEVDVQLPSASASNLKAQADTYQDLLSICVHMPACTAFQTWDFTDKHSWIPTQYHGMGWALPFDQNYKPKPAWFAMMKVLRGRGYSGSRPPAPR